MIAANESTRGRAAAAWAILTAVFAYAIMDAASKSLVKSIPAFEIVFARNAQALIGIVVISLLLGKRAYLATKQPVLQVARATVGNIAIVLFVAAVRHLALAQVSAIAFLVPLLVLVWDRVVFGQRCTPLEWGLVLAGLGCIWVGIRPGLDMPFAAAAEPALGAALLALYLSMTKRFHATETTMSLAFYFSLTGTVLSAFWVPVGWSTPDTVQTVLLIVVGVCGGAGLLLRNAAYRLARTAFVVPFEYTLIVWAVVFGLTLFGDVPSWNLLLAAGGIVSLNLLHIVQQNRRESAPVTMVPASSLEVRSP